MGEAQRKDNGVHNRLGHPRTVILGTIDPHMLPPAAAINGALPERRSPRQDDFAKRPILDQMAQGFARFAEGIDPLDNWLD
jgi:hypothetical protein